MTPIDPRFLADVAEVVGDAHLWVDVERTASAAVDWTGRFRAPPAPVVRPADAAEVAAVVELARAAGAALVPQGGNTGLVGGAVPGDGGVVVDLRRLDGVLDIDPLGGQLTALAGTPVAVVQAAAQAAGWAYGVDWAARDSATIGGSVATDAGGLRFVRHGGTRRQLIGIDAVLGTGDRITHLSRVEKDNTGYDLAGLLCGSEGTLGLVTAARLRLVAPAPPTATALVGFADVGRAVAAASHLRRWLPGLEAVELMLADGLDLVRAAFDLPAPLARPAPVVLLVEAGDPDDPAGRLAAALASMDGVEDAAVAVDGPAQARLWRYRELHTEAIARVGSAHKLDVTLPLDVLAAFVDEIRPRVVALRPDAQVWCFGHAADGNVHVNVTGLGLDPDDDAVDDLVLRTVAEAGGSISAEHGIGRAKRRWLHLAHSAEEVAAMVAIKRALDPDGICNPGVLLPDA